MGSASSTTPAPHNGAVALQLPVRVALAAVCAAGCVICVLIYDSRGQLKDAFDGVVAKRPFTTTLRALRDSDSPFNPSNFRDTGIAVSLQRLGRGAEAEHAALLGVRREPRNINEWITLTRIQVARQRLTAARASYARARELDPHLPRGLPAPF